MVRPVVSPRAGFVESRALAVELMSVKRDVLTAARWAEESLPERDRFFGGHKGYIVSQVLDWAPEALGAILVHKVDRSTYHPLNIRSKL